MEILFWIFVAISILQYLIQVSHAIFKLFLPDECEGEYETKKEFFMDFIPWYRPYWWIENLIDCGKEEIKRLEEKEKNNKELLENYKKNDIYHREPPIPPNFRKSRY